MTREDFIERILRSKFEAVEAFNLVMDFLRSPAPPSRLEIHFDDKLTITGRAAAFTNPVIEAGVIHCRALLEFMGLAVDRADHTKLTERRSSRRYSDDLLIEDFSNAEGTPLSRLPPIEAVGRYPDKDVAERALARVIHVAHKGVAHPTTGLIPDDADLDLFAVAGRGVPALLISYFYTPLGLRPPPSCITVRPRQSTGSP